MKLLYNLLKLSIIFEALVNVKWAIVQFPQLIFIVNSLISLACVFTIIKFKGRRQVEILFRIFLLRLFVEPLVVYFKYSSIGVSVIAIMFGTVLLLALKKLEIEVDYLD